jgi:hypothetical protein
LRHHLQRKASTLPSTSHRCMSGKRMWRRWPCPCSPACLRITL